MTFPARVVIDTNVLIVANEKSPQADPGCVVAAVDFLEYAIRGAVVVLDSGGAVTDEYKKHCSYSGQPGLGDRFFFQLHRMQGDRRHVQFVDIHPDSDGSYREVPEVLHRFDPSDRKFVAVVVADSRQSEVINAVDSDWGEAAEELNAAGVRVCQLCPGCGGRQ